ncbi:MAG: helix-hairpin-helix domain-containing protein [Anaerolineales bacterium]|nr:helix-hairpin-helix domain-containing protein [Anaerolineales bacterium]
MDAFETLCHLAGEMDWESDEERTPCSTAIPASKERHLVLYHAQTPQGKSVRLLKTLLSSACERDCFYCPFRAGRDRARATFRPEEFARLFIQLYQAGLADGLFLSSGLVGGGMRTQDKLMDAAEILRHKLDFRGYIHLKLMPGAEKDQVLRAMQLADRVSINLEAPNAQRLAQLAPHKGFFDELLQPLQWVEQIRRSQPAQQGWQGRWPSTVTQFVLGAAGESDRELLQTTEWLFRSLRLSRAYYSPFRPVPDTPLENAPPADLLRQRRLYQASFLLRDYGFRLSELSFDADANLPLEIDPKKAYAEHNLRQAPLEINRASLSQLLRVPGIGPKGAQSILKARRERRLSDLSQLQKLGVEIQRAAPYVLLNGRRPLHQLSFWGLNPA